MYLVDTNVISALSPAKRSDLVGLVGWLDQASPHLFLSVITAAEVAAGIAKAEREGAAIKAARLRDWWGAVEYLYADRILPLELVCSRAAGVLLDAARAHHPGFEDIAIAATAQVHGLTVLTRNQKHFQPLGVPSLDPFERLPPIPA